MNFNLKRPCGNCPFLKDGGIRLREARARIICDSQTASQGGSFACHKTVDYSNDSEGLAGNKDGENYCAGALIFAEKQNTANQLLRVMMRIGAYDPDALDKDAFEKVFDTKRQMVAKSL